jgi:A/G-specific adenine glycosylase
MDLAPNYSEFTHKAFVNGLMHWHKYHKLNFLWREFKDPFKILVTEILLRKTNAEKVQNLIDGVIKQIGTLTQLTNIEEEELSAMLEPFGMQHRKAFELKQLALILNERFVGKVPNTSEELMSLPGVGRYITHEVLAAAFLLPKAIVDTNVIRVYSRYFGLVSKRARTRDDPRVWEFADGLIPKDDAVGFNYALIDFAKQICVAIKPLCSKCTLSQYCSYFRPHTD